ncbi:MULTISPECIES: hypothetical protein [Calothrix]|uniref:Uncharacterized protein n=2 Tax=Calothrix TaxID=1186 RepID=A0ABR8AHF9_9CYAN|nr:MULTISPECIES: hypothetical protein [Calothrix]MBD2198743.1 hypothetical protein [Calothrix parietina FACHB-288]MBD2228609.1 hypothetical protein [Calothrix anomala FACHB-343]
MTDISIGIIRQKPTLVSTFELLVKPITPVTAPGTEAVARTVVQGYFLTIANTSNSDVKLTLQFTATTPALNIADTVTITDVQGTNDFSDLTPVPGDPSRFTFSLGIRANDTALLTLLPDVSKIEIVKAAKLEIRGYVEILVNSPSAATPVNLLLTPEHRGTFLPQNLSSRNLDLDQLAYSIPTSTGGSLFTLSGPVAKMSKELKIEVKEFEKIQKEKDFEKVQVEKLPEIDQLANPIPVNAGNDLQRLIGLMAQRLDQIEQQMGNTQNGKSFIQAQERPTVGQQVVNQPRN